MWNHQGNIDLLDTDQHRKDKALDRPPCTLEKETALALALAEAWAWAWALEWALEWAWEMDWAWETEWAWEMASEWEMEKEAQARAAKGLMCNLPPSASGST